jgi:hypothetical protein
LDYFAISSWPRFSIVHHPAMSMTTVETYFINAIMIMDMEEDMDMEGTVMIMDMNMNMQRVVVIISMIMGDINISRVKLRKTRKEIKQRILPQDYQKIDQMV